MDRIIKNLTKYQQKSKITNERQLILKDFLEKLNLDRKPPFQQLSPARLGMMMRYMTVSQMKEFYGKCKNANNFSKFFFWSFKK